MHNLDKGTTTTFSDSSAGWRAPALRPPQSGPGFAFSTPELAAGQCVVRLGLVTRGCGFVFPMCSGPGSSPSAAPREHSANLAKVPQRRRPCRFSPAGKSLAGVREPAVAAPSGGESARMTSAFISSCPAPSGSGDRTDDLGLFVDLDSNSLRESRLFPGAADAWREHHGRVLSDRAVTQLPSGNLHPDHAGPATTSRSASGTGAASPSSAARRPG